MPTFNTFPAPHTHASLMLFQNISGSVKCAWQACKQSAAETVHDCITAALSACAERCLGFAWPENGREGAAVDGLLVAADAEPDMMLRASALSKVESTAWKSRLGTSGNSAAMDIACNKNDFNAMRDCR
jgi:hypothetical protein